MVAARRWRVLALVTPLAWSVLSLAAVAFASCGNPQQCFARFVPSNPGLQADAFHDPAFSPDEWRAGASNIIKGTNVTVVVDITVFDSKGNVVASCPATSGGTNFDRCGVSGNAASVANCPASTGIPSPPPAGAQCADHFHEWFFSSGVTVTKDFFDWDTND